MMYCRCQKLLQQVRKTEDEERRVNEEVGDYTSKMVVKYIKIDKTGSIGKTT